MNITDQTGYTLHLRGKPGRIVCLVPSITEFLCDIGLQPQLAGVTKFCIHPENVRQTAAVVGGTKNYSTEKIRALAPDIVIANKEENVRESIEELRQHLPVYVTDIVTLEQSLDMMQRLGALFGREEAAAAIIRETEQAFMAYTLPAKPLRAAYFIWRRPFMSVGRDTFIHDILQRLGMQNVFAAYPGRYPEITVEDLQCESPELVLLSSEPYPFGEKHREEIRKILPAARILLVDGECYSWYGSSVRKAPAYTRQWLNA
ncbi:MAG: helical backbone metal receptor [Flavobacteriales bacterium]